MKVVHVLIMGFTQGLGRETGMEKLWNRLHQRAGGDVTVGEPLKWCADMSDRAAFIQRNRKDAKISICAYSWGAGYGFIQLCKQLNRRGLTVSNALLIDPVYRSRLPFTRWLAMLNAPKIRVPANVDEVDHYYQQFNRPRGHDLILDSSTELNSSTLINVPHAEMDDQKEIHDRYMNIARELEADELTPDQKFRKFEGQFEMGRGEAI